MANENVIQDYASAINASWLKTVDSILETARLCAEAFKALSPGDRNRLLKKLIFSSATFSKLTKIGQHQQLKQAAIKILLPPSYSIIYSVSKLSPAELEAAINEKIVVPSMSRADLDAWKAERAGKETTQSPKEKVHVIGTLQVPSDYDGKREAELETALDELRAKFGFTLERPRDLYAEALDRMSRQIDDYIRKGARRYIRQLKARRMKSLPKYITARERKKRWGFAEDETEIRDDATWEEVRAVLDFIGNGDEFERLRDEALRLHDVPEKYVREHPAEDSEEAMNSVREALAQIRKSKGELESFEKYRSFK